MSNSASDLLLVERSNTVYKCTYEDFRKGAFASKGLVLAITRNWTNSYTATGGQIYGSPSGTTWYAQGSTTMNLSTTGLSANTSQSYARRPAMQVYVDNLDGRGTSGWSDWVINYMYWGAYDSYDWINGGSGNGYTSNINIWNVRAVELQGAIRAPDATISKIRFYLGNGYQYASGSDFKIGYKLINDDGAGDFINTKYSGTTGGYFTTFYSSSSVPSMLTSGGYKDFTANQYNISWT